MVIKPINQAQICSSCQLSWHKDSHHGRFQAPNLTLNVALERDAQKHTIIYYLYHINTIRNVSDLKRLERKEGGSDE